MNKTTASKICCIFNLAPHYNAAVYILMDKELICDFYIGDRLLYPIELMDYNKLKGFKRKLQFLRLAGNFYWQRGAISLAFKPYTHYIITGEPFCVSSWIILFLNRLSGRKSFLWSHGWYGDEKGIKKMFKKLFFGLSHKILLYGNYAKNLMIKEGIDAGKLETIYNSLDYETQVSIRQELKDTLIYKNHFQNEYPVLLYIGRIQARKKIELLVEAVSRLKKKGVGSNLVIIGKENEGNNIPEEIDKLNLNDNVWLYGPCYDERIIGELVYNAHVCVVPGDIGLTAMHSLVYGTPVITHDNFINHGPEFESIQPGINGDFFIENSIDDLTEKIIKWIDLSGAQRNSIREKCYKIIDEKYNPRMQVEVIKKAIQASENK